MSALEVQVGGDHYRKMKIQPIEYIQANGLGFAEGCIVKYVSRWRAKNGLQDLEKIKHYVDLLIEHEKKRIAQASALAAGKRMFDQASVLSSDRLQKIAMPRCICQSPADCSGQCYGNAPL